MSNGKKLNIAYLGNNNPLKFKRGVENVIATQGLCIDGVKYYLFFDNKSSVFRWDSFICIGIKNNIFKYLALNIILFALKKRHSDIIIHSHGPVKTIFLLYQTDILTVHDAIYYQRKGNRQRNYFIFYIVEKWAYMRCKKIHFISKYAMNQSLITKKQKKKSVVFYNTSTYENYKNNNYKEDLNSSRTSSIQLFAIRGIQERTRIDLLIDFANYIKDKEFDGKKITLKVAGKGHLLDYYRNEIEKRKLTNIVLLGFVSDDNLLEYYKNSDMIIMPCEHAEGFGLPIIEGYLFNKPVIASNKCAVPEIIYSNDYLFENTPQSIEETINRIINKHVDFYSFYQKKYSVKNYISSFLNLYKSIDK